MAFITLQRTLWVSFLQEFHISVDENLFQTLYLLSHISCKDMYVWAGRPFKRFYNAELFQSQTSVTDHTGVVPDNISRLLHHMAHYASHTICHCLLVSRHCCHGDEEEVSTVDGMILVRRATLTSVQYVA